ncbi:hypothetical protein RclHR1_02270016 [Rhizophagus clarus]|uniref:Ankyrin repeat and zinc finger domain-containing protein n=1 Tax=Rhizophagus clarus TaxID=94130 RepID=A0A2Z6QZE3_9GLOM|nr:hypothetical protein RclHR1_02270016 [Rhizophagus clarus]GET01749.1 ankyrin repeat and zinc finger domain-containing protein [Rhizophagus clarus]
MDIKTLLLCPIQIFSLPPEILSALTLREDSLKSLTKLILDSEAITKIKEIDIFTEPNKNDENDPMKPTCFVCGIKSFENVEQQREHYKLDWHRFNVKMRAVNLERNKSQYKPITEEGFEELMGDSLSSISGSCSDTSDDDITMHINNLEIDDNESSEKKISAPILWFTCPPLTINLGIYKNILNNLGENAVKDIHKLQIKPNKGENPRLWTMLMIRGGHFAALVLDITANTKVTNAKEVKSIVHKTFHRYTTRRKQGGSQASNDNSKGKAKSAGADLRRYNESALQKSIRALIEQWKSMIEESELIFIHAPSHNKNILYNYEGAVLKKDDKRIRSFPFSTKRPTFTELRKSFIELTRVKVLEVKEDEDSQEPLKNNLTEENLINSQIIIESLEGSREDQMESVEPVESSNTIEQASNIVIKMIQLIKKGKFDLFVNHITKHSIDVTDLLPVTPISENDNSKTPTLLHLASYFGHHDIIEYLLNQGADPTIISKKNMTPYDLANDKETRNVFRRYMAEHMDKWNWIVAHVPSPLTKEMEEEQQNKLKEKKKKNKVKKKKATAIKKEKELEGKIATESNESKLESSSSASTKLTSSKTLDSASSLIGLPPEMRMKIERERRARAAEARLKSTLINLPSIGNVVCTMCGKSLSELVPFEVSELKFCSVNCVKNYRESTLSSK